jgi:hypothetical protein
MKLPPVSIVSGPQRTSHSKKSGPSSELSTRTMGVARYVCPEARASGTISRSQLRETSHPADMI